MRGREKKQVIILAMLIAAAMCSPAMAHKVNIFAYEEKGTIYTESYFVDGTPCRQSRIIIYGSKEQVLTRGTTDDAGLFSFEIEHPQDVRIVLEASMGHRNEIQLAASEMSHAFSPKASKEKRDVSAVEESPVLSRSVTPPASEGPTSVSPEQTRAVVENILDDRLTLVKKEIADLRRAIEKPGLSDVIGGLGWIIGLAGAYLWGISRRRRE